MYVFIVNFLKALGTWHVTFMCSVSASIGARVFCFQVLSASFSPQTQHELLNKFAGAGLSATYKFTRTVSIFSPKMTSVELVFTNQSDDPIHRIKIKDKVCLLNVITSKFLMVNVKAYASDSLSRCYMCIICDAPVLSLTVGMIHRSCKLE